MTGKTKEKTKGECMLVEVSMQRVTLWWLVGITVVIANQTLQFTLSMPLALLAFTVYFMQSNF